MTSVTSTRGRRDALLRRLLPLARQALFGTLSETYRTCGRVGCRCQTYRQLMGHTRAVVRQAESAAQHVVAAGTVGAVGLAQLELEGLAQRLRETGGLVRRVLAQTRARILTGNEQPAL
jgi:hypothetical protein